jgi:hypothetical protein
MWAVLAQIVVVAVVASRETCHETPIAEWLSSVNPALAEHYAKDMAEYGYDTAGILFAADTADLVEGFEELNIKKPHRRLLFTALQEKEAKDLKSKTSASNSHHTADVADGVRQLPCISADGPSEQREVDMRQYIPSGITNKKKVQQWFNKYNRAHPADEKLMQAVENKDFKRLRKMCKRGQIKADAKVYTVPLLNWLGKYQSEGEGEGASSQLHPLVPLTECLMKKAAIADAFVTTNPQADMPAEVRKYLNLPLLLQAAEISNGDLIESLVRNGADVTATYRLPNGGSTGITALHAVLMYADPTDYMKVWLKLRLALFSVLCVNMNCFFYM